MQQRGASVNKAVSLKRGAGAGKSTAAPAVAAGTAGRRLRFAPPGAAEGWNRARAGVAKSWQRLLISLRLGRTGTAQDASKHAGVRAQAAASSAHPGSTGSLVRRWPSLAKIGTGAEALLKQAGTFDGLMAILLSIMLFYPPFFRGLFFQNELLPTHMLTAAVFALFAFYKLTRHELAFFESPLDYAVFILLALYITSSFNAWSVRDAIAGILKMANYAAIYWLLAYSVRSLNAVRGYLAVWLASGAGVALLGLGAAVGSFPYKDAFVGGRIYSSLQYPNTLAAFLTAINLSGLYLWTVSRNRIAGTLLAIGNYLVFLTILGTQSRGGYVILPLGLLLLLIGLPGRERWRTLGLFVLQLIPASAVIGGVMANTGGHSQLRGWIWIAAGAVLVSLLYLVWRYIETSRQQGQAQAAGRNLKPWVVPAVAVLILVVLAGGGYLGWQKRSTITSVASKAVQYNWTSRLQTISLQDKNAQERILWSKDALRIMTASPLNALVGGGGGAWNAIYHQYQQYLYFTTEVHDHFMQIGVETGFPGLITFLAIWVCFIATAWSLYRSRRAAGRKPDQALQGTTWAILSSAVALGAHSMIDFNLSLGAVAILLWGLFGLVRGLDRLYGPAATARAEAAAALERKTGGNRRRKQEPAAWKMSPSLQGLIVGGLALAVFFCSLNLIIGIQYAQAADQAAKKQDVQTAVTDYEQAVKHDYWDSDYRAILTEYYLYQASQSTAKQASASQDNTAAINIGKALDVMRVAVRQNRGSVSNFDLHMLYGNCLFQTGSIEQALQQLEESVALMPLRQDSYENLAIAYFRAGRYLLEQTGQPQQSGAQAQDTAKLKQEAQNDLKLALAMPQRVQNRMAAVPASYRQWWTNAQETPLLEPSLTTYQQAGEAAALLGRWQDADTNLKLSLKDAKLAPETQLWQGLILQQQGKTAEGQALIAQAVKQTPGLAQDETAIRLLLPK